MPKAIRNNIIFLPFIALLVILFILKPKEVKNYPLFVDWLTIAALTGLLVITNGIKESSFFTSLSRRLLSGRVNQRAFAVHLVTLSTILPMILTNDIALFLIVPLTVGFSNFLDIDFEKIVVFEAISVNVGSTLTPIGNPQNLFIWHQWKISFLSFIKDMFPIFAIMFAVLLLLTITVFPRKRITVKNFTEPSGNGKIRKSLLYISMILLVVFVLLMELRLAHYFLPFVLIIYLVFFRNVIIRTDWGLILLFAIMFIDFHLLSQLGVVSTLMSKINLSTPGGVFLTSLGASQAISNVPASVFMAKFTHDWHSIAYGVNVGGNGLVIASLANIIALRLAGGGKIFARFHRYSIAYFAVTAGLSYVLFFR